MEPLTLKNLPTQSPLNWRKPAKNAMGFVPFTRAFSSHAADNALPEEADKGQSHSGDSKIEFIDDKGVIKKIKITCSCGEVTILDCVYEDK